MDTCWCFVQIAENNIWCRVSELLESLLNPPNNLSPLGNVLKTLSEKVKVKKTNVGFMPYGDANFRIKTIADNTFNCTVGKKIAAV